jgi:hypothetical protein
MMKPMTSRFVHVVLALVSFGAAALSAQRTSDGRPDLHGVWTNGTLTPLTRPAEFANRFSLTETEAAEFERTGFERMIKTVPETDRVTAGDLSEVYLDTTRLKVVPDRRTSLIVDPPNGMLPAQLPKARERNQARKLSYDDPESRTLDERCLASFVFGGSSGAPPLVPNPVISDLYRIVQTPRTVMIVAEGSDARVVRIGGTHLPSTIRRWIGDSIGWWEGDTLVVDTTNFTDKTHYRGSSERLHVVERFTRTDASTLRYRATIEDPDTWAAPWTVEVPFRATSEQMFEYACHEGNYSMENSLRGMRAKERDDEAAARKK